LASSRGAPESHVVPIRYQDKPSIDKQRAEAELQVMVMTKSQKLEQAKTREVGNDNLTSHEEPPHLNEPKYYKETWMEPIVEYLASRKLPLNQTEARRM